MLQDGFIFIFLAGGGEILGPVVGLFIFVVHASWRDADRRGGISTSCQSPPIPYSLFPIPRSQDLPPAAARGHMAID